MLRFTSFWPTQACTIPILNEEKEYGANKRPHPETAAGDKTPKNDKRTSKPKKRYTPPDQSTPKPPKRRSKNKTVRNDGSSSASVASKRYQDPVGISIRKGKGVGVATTSQIRSYGHFAVQKFDRSLMYVQSKILLALCTFYVKRHQSPDPNQISHIINISAPPAWAKPDALPRRRPSSGVDALREVASSCPHPTIDPLGATPSPPPQATRCSPRRCGAPHMADSCSPVVAAAVPVPVARRTADVGFLSVFP